MNEDGEVICALPFPPRKVMVMARWLARKAVIEEQPATIYEATEAYLRRHGARLIYQAEDYFRKN